MNNPTTNPTTALSRWAYFSRMFRGLPGVMLLAGLTAALLILVFMSGCKDEITGVVNCPVLVAPTVISTSPTDSATNVPLSKTIGAAGLAKAASVKKIAATSKTSGAAGTASVIKTISATFSTPMDANSITTSTFNVRQGTTPILGMVLYTDTTALFVVPNGLDPNLWYDCTITTGAKDVAGTALASNYRWSFKTAAGVTAALSSNPAAGGTTSGGGTFSSGSSVIVTATPNAGYTFTKWTEHGNQLSTNPIYQFTITRDTALVANFTAVPPTQYTVTVLPIPSAGGTASGGGAFNSGSLVTVTANANAGYTFTNWTENGIVLTSSINYQFVISGNRTLVANFTTVAPTQNTVALSSNPFAGGTTSGAGAFTSGSSVIVTATPNAGYTFINWTEGTPTGLEASKNPIYQFTITRDTALVANFTAIAPTQYTITLLSIPSIGGATSGGGAFTSGSLVTVTANANAGYTFTNWTENGIVLTSSLSYQFTISGNRTLLANFTAVTPTQNTVAISSNPLAGGTTSGGGAFTSGSSVIVTATPNAGYTFTNWTEGVSTVSTNPIYQFTISGNRTLVANFTAIAPTQYTVTLLSIPSIGGATSGGGAFTSGTSVTVTATPNAGYTFKNWTENGIVLTSSLSYQFTISGNRTLLANFTAVTSAQKTVTLSSIPLAGGTTSGGGAFDSLASVIVTATPHDGYKFTNWTVGVDTLSDNPIYQFTIIRDTVLVANFTAIAPTQYTITVLPIPSAGGTTSGAGFVDGIGTFNSGTLVTLTATPNAGYTFKNWTENGIVLTSSISYQFTVNGNRTLVANFTAVPPIQYIVTLSSIPLPGGTTSGGGAFTSGSSVIVTATPNAGYTFTKWTEHGNQVSTNPIYQFTITRDTALAANFAINTYTLTASGSNGTVTLNPVTGPYNYGTSVTLTAVPDVGYRFVSWSGDTVGKSAATSPMSVIMTANRVITANFTINMYTLTTNGLHGTVTLNPMTGPYNYGTSVALTAVPDVGYRFVSWSGDTVGKSAATSPMSVIMTANRVITAKFAVVGYTVTLLCPSGGGNLYGAGTFAPGPVTVSTSSKPGFKFTNWTEGTPTGLEASTNAIYTFTITKDTTLVANFGAGQMPVNLGSAGNFAILAGTGVSNTGVNTHIYGDVGSFPTATIVGLLAGNVTGTLYTTADPLVGTAKNDLTTAYNDAQGRSSAAISLPGQLGGLTFAPGLYVNSSTSGISGTGSNAILTLDAKGDSNAVWIFKMGSTLVTTSGTSIVLAGNAQWKNIYWSVGSSATLGTNSIFYGNILAEASITLTTGATLNGRALTRTAAVTLDTNIIDKR